MSSVIINLPAHTEPNLDLIRFHDSTGPAGLGDVSVLSAESGGVRYLTRIDLVRSSISRVIIRVADVLPDPNIDGDDLSEEWELSESAITLQFPGLSDIIIKGPNNPDSLSSDNREIYSWFPGPDAVMYGTSTLAQWINDYKVAYAADNTIRGVLILDDGEGVDGVPVDFSFSAHDGEVFQGTPGSAAAFEYSAHAGEAIEAARGSLAGFSVSASPGMLYEGPRGVLAGFTFSAEGGTRVPVNRRAEGTPAGVEFSVETGLVFSVIVNGNGSRIDRISGLMFPENDRRSYLQSVQDRILVRKGTRLDRPEYGTLVGRINPQDSRIPDEITRGLASDDEIEALEIQVLNNRVEVSVRYENANIEISV